MPNRFSTLLSTAWVKNVYSLWVAGGKTCVNIYTALYMNMPKALTLRVKPHLFTHVTTSFTPSLYTAFFSRLTDVKSGLYTVSTAPITNKTN